jgi:hypothetical protein
MEEERKVHKVFGGKAYLDYLEDQGVGGKMGSEREIGLGVWIGFNCLRTGTGGGLL